MNFDPTSEGSSPPVILKRDLAILHYDSDYDVFVAAAGLEFESR